MFVASAAAAPPQGTLACGTTITKNTVLRADITGCTGPGLIIGANGVTLDLGGHVVSGAAVTITSGIQCEEVGEGSFDCHPCDGPGDPPCGPPFATPGGFVETNTSIRTPDVPAIDNTGGFDRVIVRNGRVRDFQYGVRFINADRFQATDLKADPQAEVPGVFPDPMECVVCAEASQRGRVARIGPNGLVEVRLSGTSDTVVEDAGYVSASASDRNTFRQEAVTLADGSDRNLIEGTRVSTRGSGFFEILGGTGNTIRRNRVLGVGHAIVLQGSSGNVVEENVLSAGCDEQDPSVWLRFGASDNTIRRNQISKPLCIGSGIAVCDGAHNVIEDNDLRGLAFGVSMGFEGDCGDEPLVGSVIRGNRVTGSTGDDGVPGDGIIVGSRARGTLVEHNSVLGNSGNGISVLNRTTRLGRNLAVGNGGLGIAAPLGAVDLGGNRASANGNPAQCTGIVCR